MKILREEYIRRPDFQERFLAEAKAIARLSHPNLVTVYDFGIQDGQYFMIMEYVEGEDLKSFLRRAPGRSLGAAYSQPIDLWLDITIQVCEGLGLAHRAGLVHCDMKPQNVLLSGEMIAKIADFGIARALGRSAAAENPADGDVIWGSPQYVSPEQAAGDPLTPSSDIYSTGVMLFELLTGRLPFPGKDPRTLSLQHQLEPAPSPRLINPSLPAGIGRDRLARPGQGSGSAISQRRSNGAGAENLSGRASGRRARKLRTPKSEIEEEPGVEWKAVGLGFLDLIAIGSLIPLWVYVFFLYNPPGK